jgi:Carboxypeptidase regulatory-like domain/TonB dependent receptor/TonB-dependent Receptor Plug Domain
MAANRSNSDFEFRAWVGNFGCGGILIMRIHRSLGFRFGGLIVILLGAVICVKVAGAQTTSTIEGTVTDKQGLAVANAQVHAEGVSIAADRSVTTEANGAYRLSALPAGTYKLTVTRDGFQTGVFTDLEVTLNRILQYNVQLNVGSAHDQVEISSELPLLETQSSATSTTIMPRDIVDLPINGRNYLDLLQLVPGVAINRQADANSDTATPVLGERANNTGFLIDGLPNQNELNGGPAAQFNQDTIAEFQVITTGYKAEFGHSSGGVVNVITRSGANDTHGLASAYFRNNVFDSSNISGKDAPYLLRWDYDLAAGGAIVRDKAFWFGSAEGIHENRQLNFVAPDGTPQFIIDNEEKFNEPTTNRETRLFAKFDQVLGNHHLTEQANYTNLHINSTNPLSASTNLPSTRTNLGDRNLFLGFSDTATFGNSASPFILSLRGQYRSEPTLTSAAHPEAGPNTLFNVFSGFDTGLIFGDVASPSFGALFTPSTLDQKYATFGASLAKTLGRHTIKFGWDFERTQVDGVEAAGQFAQLFATQADYQQFGPVDAGFFTLTTTGGLTPQANQIKLRNNYDGLWIQDDWRVTHNFTLNGGLRWDYDSAFQKADNISPRIGFAWSVTPKTVIRGSFGLFYDHFRLGLVRDIPGFGGADIRVSQPFSFPRLFYGVPTLAPAIFGVCQSTSLTDAEIAAAGAGASCPFPGSFGNTDAFYGIDHLNGIGPTPIPANSAVNISNVQQLSGLSPDAFLAAADAAIGRPSDFWFWGPFGALSFNVFQPGNYPVTIDPSFATPYSRSYSLGVQHQLSNDWVFSLDYYHKRIQNLLGLRETNIPFEARIDNSAGSIVPVNGFGPWYSGVYDAGILSFEKRMSLHFTLGGSYAFVSENDDALNSNLGTGAIAGTNGFPTDSFRGVPSVVTDPGDSTCPGGTNATAAFFACNGNYVPKAGVFYDGAKLDSGPSDFTLRHTFEVHGLVELPWKIQFSSLLRAQSGFHYTNSAAQTIDQDGNGTFNGRDLKTGRNAFSAPPFVNMDLRIAKTWVIREKFSVQGLFEFFNLFNNANPAAIQNQESQASTLGTVSQRLPGREGQVGLRLTF